MHVELLQHYKRLLEAELETTRHAFAYGKLTVTSLD